MLVIAGRTGSALTGAVYVSKDTAVPAVRRTTAALRLMAQHFTHSPDLFRYVCVNGCGLAASVNILWRSLWLWELGRTWLWLWYIHAVPTPGAMQTILAGINSAIVRAKTVRYLLSQMVLME